MFCKVCFDCGKSSFNDHNVKDYGGNVICPVLLNTKCLKCGYFGHTNKYCKNEGIMDLIKKYNIETIKAVRFEKDIKSYSIGQNHCVKQNYSLESLFCSLVVDDDYVADYEDSYEDFDINDIIWGVGHRSMINVSWADACGV